MPFDPTKERVDEEPPPADAFLRPAIPPAEEFLRRFSSEISRQIRNAYGAERSPSERTHGGSCYPILSLAQDVDYLLTVQTQVLDEYLSASDMDGTLEGDDVRTDAVFGMLHAVYCRQLVGRDRFLTDWERCCAAANDFWLLAEAVEGWAMDLTVRYPFLALIEVESDCAKDPSPRPSCCYREVPDLVHLLCADAVHATQAAHVFFFKALEEDSDLPEDLFGLEWEEDSCHSVGGSHAARSLVMTLEEYTGDMETMFCSDVLEKKAMDALVRQLVVFYSQCLLRRAVRARQQGDGKVLGSKKIYRGKERAAGLAYRAMKMGTKAANPSAPRNPSTDAESHEGRCCGPFSDSVGAAHRINADVFQLKIFFKTWVLQMPNLDNTVEEEFRFLKGLCDCVSDAADAADGELSDYVSVIFMRSGHRAHLIIDDLISLVVTNRDLRAVLCETARDRLKDAGNGTRIDEKTLQLVAPRNHPPGLELDAILSNIYGRKDSSQGPNKKISPQAMTRSRQLPLRSPLKLNNVHIQYDKAKAKQSAHAFLQTCKKAGNLKK